MLEAGKRNIDDEERDRERKKKEKLTLFLSFFLLRTIIIFLLL